MSKYDQADFEARKAAMLEEIRAVMDDVEELYNSTPPNANCAALKKKPPTA